MAALIRRSLLLAAGLALLAGCQKAPDAAGGGPSVGGAFQGVDITGAAYAKELSLPDPDGKLRTLAEFKGQVVVLFFGYTQCPDVCPATMAELAAVKRELGDEGKRVTGIFVSVDPERDTPEVLKAYVQAFDPAFVALRGTDEQVKAAAKEFKIFYAKVPGKAEGSYTMDHTAGSFLFDPQGRVRVFTRYGTGAAALQNDLKLLLAGK